MRVLDNGGWGSTETLIVDGPPALDDLVEHTWIDDRRQRVQLPRQYRIVPDTAPHLIAALVRGDDALQLRAVLVGARTHHIDIDASRRILTVGVRLRPGALPSLGIRHADLLTDSSRALSHLSPRSTAVLRQLAQHGDARAIADELHSHVRAMYRRPVDGRAAQLFHAPLGLTGMSRRRERSLGLGDRGARAWASRTAGMSLRQFQSIRRLHEALLHHIAHPELTWSRVAALAGYADHSHLIRDCRKLLGETPARFARRADSFKT